MTTPKSTDLSVSLQVALDPTVDVPPEEQLLLLESTGFANASIFPSHCCRRNPHMDLPAVKD
jgi:hypothetical protein